MSAAHEFAEARLGIFKLPTWRRIVWHRRPGGDLGHDMLLFLTS
jgi:hypothetical protein